MAIIESTSNNEITIGWGKEKTFGEVLTNALSISKKLDLSDDVKIYVHTNSIGYGDVKVEITKDMTIGDLRESFLAASKINQQAKVETGKEQDEFVYHSFDEMVADLKQIKPCDLTTETTSIKDAVKFCEDVFLVMIKAEDLRFSDEQATQFSTMLKALGCCRYNEAAQKFIKFPDTAIGDLSATENNIEFPLYVFDNIVEESPSSIRSNLTAFVDGGMDGVYCGTWIQTQQQAKAKAVEQA